MINHTFAICAYKESPYLEECIRSIKAQRVESKILIATSTDNDYIRDLAADYGIPVLVNKGEGGITQDWNFALSQVTTRYATVAHQDDYYGAGYSMHMIDMMEKSKNPIIGFCEYYEIRDDKRVYNTRMLNIKRLMLSPFRIKGAKGSRFVRRRILSMGDPICCPSVMFCLDNVERPIFNNHFRSAEDWEAWERLSRLKGDFCYMPKALMGHRIHEESETSKIIADGARIEENLEMYAKFWPTPIAKAINYFYTKSEKSNTV